MPTTITSSEEGIEQLTIPKEQVIVENLDELRLDETRINNDKQQENEHGKERRRPF